MDGARTPASVDLLTHVGDEAGIEPLTRNHDLFLTGARSSWQEYAELPVVSTGGASCPGGTALLPWLFLGMLPSLTGSQCPTSAFLSPPGAGLQ